MKTYIHLFLQPLRRSQSGAVLIEFVMVAPFLILLLFGSVELTRYVLIIQKFDKSVYAMGDVLSQSAPATSAGASGELNASTLNGILALYDNMMSPFDDPSRQSAIATSLQRDTSSANRIIRWQVAGGGSFSGAGVVAVANGLAPASIGPSVAGDIASFPGNPDVAALTSGMLPDENMIIMETFYLYRPFLANLLEGFGFNIQSALLTRRAYLYPRNGALAYLPPTFPVP